MEVMGVGLGCPYRAFVRAFAFGQLADAFFDFASHVAHSLFQGWIEFALGGHEAAHLFQSLVYG